MKTALICGVSGQDGSYLAKFLIEKGYRVVGTSRDAQVSTFSNLHRLGIFEKVEKDSLVLTDFRSTLQTIAKINPDQVYNLAGQTSVGLSFQQPVETMESISLGTLNLLESIRFLNKDIRLYNASSSECFGDTGESAANEETPFRPRSPYAVAKASAHWTAINYRDSYGLFVANGILFNHESPLRPHRFVTKKIIEGAHQIKTGNKHGKLRLGKLEIQRDWGWAPEYVEAMWRMMQLPMAEDFVIATGATYSLENFLELAFREVGLHWLDHVEIDESFSRPSDIHTSRGDATKARTKLNWQPTVTMPQIVQLMMAAEPSI